MMPETFRMQDGKAMVIKAVNNQGLADEKHKKQLYDMASKCPSKAIEINLYGTETTIQES